MFCLYTFILAHVNIDGKLNYCVRSVGTHIVLLLLVYLKEICGTCFIATYHLIYHSLMITIHI